MVGNLARIICCPECSRPLSQPEPPFVCENGHSFGFENGFPALVFPRELLGSDAEFRAKYDEGAGRYDEGMRWLFHSFYEEEAAVRGQMLALLDVQPGHRILEISGGTGAMAELIRGRLGRDGWLALAELSPSMLARARERLGSDRIDYVVCNGSYLPFADASFDRVFHFGGINEFAEKERAITEMARVTKPGGVVLFGDESVPPWQRERRFGKVLIAANKLYRHEPPLASLPENIAEVSIRWVLGGAFYLIQFRVTAEPPPLDLDLPIPGRGDSLRSRFLKAFPGQDL